MTNETTIRNLTVLTRYLATGNAHMSTTELREAGRCLRQLSERHHRFCEYLCSDAEFVNGTARWAGRTGYERLERLEAKISAYIAPMLSDDGITAIVFQRDPRGATVKFLLCDGRSNDFGGEAWHI